MNKGVLAVILALSLFVIAYILLGFGDKLSEVKQPSPTLLEMGSQVTEVEEQEQQIADSMEIELENELDKIENSEEMELTEEIK